MSLFARLAAVGLEMGFSVAAGALAGYFLDGKLGTRPYLTIAGVLLGVAAAGRALWRAARAAMARAEEEERRAGKGDGEG